MGRCHESRVTTRCDVCVPRRDAVESRSIDRARAALATAGGLGLVRARGEDLMVMWRDDVGASHLDELDVRSPYAYGNDGTAMV